MASGSGESPLALLDLRGLSFSHGLAMQERIKSRLAASVTHHSLDRVSFLLVASFGRCKFRLDVDSVGLLLQAALGGHASHFFVSALGDRVFRFAVSSKQVGLFISSLRFFSCDSFVVFFHLWGNGGPNWRQEHRQFLREEDDSWSSPEASSRSFADVAKLPPRQASSVSTARSPQALDPPGSSQSRLHDASSSLAKINGVLSGANAIPVGAARSRPSAAAAGVLSGANTVPLGEAPFFKQGQRSRHCSRCLANSHWRPNCRQPIRCNACLFSGHVAAACPRKRPTREHNTSSLAKENAALVQGQRWRPRNDFVNPAAAQPSITAALIQANRPIEDSQLPPEIPRRPISGPSPRERFVGEESYFAVPDPSHWSLFPPVDPSSSSPSRSSATEKQENPNPHCHIPAQIDLNQAAQEEEVMAFQRADPEPFIPGYLEVQEVPGRKFFSRSVAPTRPVARNENLAIVTIDPIPGNPMHFAAVRGVVRDFLRDEAGIAFTEIKPTSLGQAMVRLKDGHARDALVQDSPHAFDNVFLSFAKHNRGRNWRAAEFNLECWLLLLDFPRDYLYERYIQQSVADFAQVLLFQLVDGVEASLLVRAIVKDISQVPQFVVIEDPDSIGGESWTVQCEVLRSKEPIDFPPPQDPEPENNILEHPMPFDFFGLGQPVADQIANADGHWDPWPEQAHDVNQELQDNPEAVLAEGVEQAVDNEIVQVNQGMPA